MKTRYCSQCEIEITDGALKCPVCDQPSRSRASIHAYNILSDPNLGSKLFWALVLCIGIIGTIVTVTRTLVGSPKVSVSHANEQAVSESQKWWDLGYQSGAALGKQAGTRHLPIPTVPELDRSAREVRQGFQISDHSDEFERGFKYGFRDAYKAATKPAF